MRAARTNDVEDLALEFADGFGARRRTPDPSSPEPLESLQLAAGLVAATSFEFMLRERVSRLANFRHSSYARVRRVDRLDGGAGLGLVSEVPAGARLSQILEVAEACGLELDVNAALCLVRQLVPALAMLHQNAREVSHGALAPERIIVTSNARAVIAEYVLGAAVEQLGWNRDRLWRELRVATPPAAGMVRLSHRTDVMQLGMVALALVLGRPLRDDDLQALPALVASATETAGGHRAPISDALRRWLSRTLQLDARSSFESALEAQLALDDVLSGESGYVAAPIALETFLARFEEHAAAVSVRMAPAEPPPPPAPGAAAEPAPAVVQPLDPAPGPPPPQPPPAPEPDPAPLPAAARPAHEPVMPRPVASTRGPVFEMPSAASAPDAIPPATAVEIAPLAAATSAESSSPTARRQSGSFAVPKPTAEPPASPTRDDGEGIDSEAQIRQLFAEAEPLGHTGVNAGWRWAALALALVALAEGGFIGWKYRTNLSLMALSTGTLKVDTKPSGAQLKIDGQVRGATPLTISLSRGTHVMELGTGGEPRVIPITVEPGVTVAQYVELATAAPLGRLAVASTPPGAVILLDGQPRGTAPMEVHDIAAGDHELVLELNGARVRQPVTVAAGTTTTVNVPMTPDGQPSPVEAGPPMGGLAVKVPYVMQIFEGDRLLGPTSKRLPLPEGPHDIEIVSETLAFRTSAHVDIVAGKMSFVPVALPKGTISLNATPWAEVWIDGARVGETPLGNFPITIGPHEIVFKNPELGERHEAATVTAAEPVRVSVDMSAPQ